MPRAVAYSWSEHVSLLSGSVDSQNHEGEWAQREAWLTWLQHCRDLRGKSRFERSITPAGGWVAGVDEVGRGPLAGPVVAAAVILPPGVLLPGLDDSKRLSPTQRESLVPSILRRAAAVGFGACDSITIDRVNIRNAALTAMAQALHALAVCPEAVIVDGREPVPSWPGQQVPIVHGDGLCNSVAAASVLAKVARDRLMFLFHHFYPQYGFASHKGYSTPEHREALRRWGPCPIHRRRFVGEHNGQLSLFDRETGSFD